MPALEDDSIFDFLCDDEDDGAVADMNNLDTKIQKFRFIEVKTASIPMETHKPLLKDKDGEKVDVHMYRYQVNPKVSHLYVVKKIFSPYKPTTVLVQAVEATDDSLVIPEHTTVETPMNMTPENPAHFEAEKEAIHLILTGIGDKIYSTVDACQIAQEMDKDMQKNLALIAKYFKKIYKPTNNNLKTSSNFRNKNVDTTLRFKNDNQSRQFGNQRMVNVDADRENVGSHVVQQSGIQCFNYKEFGHFAKECRKPKRVKDSAYHKEKMLLYKQAEQGVPLQAEQYDWLADTDEEVDQQELEAHYSYMAKI
nr:hypothetical protein [Tanacetum cinerariifolium]